MAIYDLFKSYVMFDLIEMILCYISLLKSLWYQTEESIPILQTNFVSLQFHFAYQTQEPKKIWKKKTIA